MSNIQRLGTTPRYSEAVIHGKTLYLSGQLADDLEADIGGQTLDTLRQIEARLTEAGTDKSRLLSATLYLRDMHDYAAMNAVWDTWLTPGTSPARTTVQALLYDPRVRIEITVIAALP